MIKPLLILAASIFLLLANSTISQAEDFPGDSTVGISIDSDSNLIIRKIVSDDSAVSIGVGLSASHSNLAGSSDSDSSGITLTFGYRNYFGHRNYREKDQFNYLLDFDFTYSYNHYESSGTFSTTTWFRGFNLSAYYGVEHFFNNHLSISGRLGIGIDYTESNSNTYTSRISLPEADIALTYYW